MSGDRKPDVLFAADSAQVRESIADAVRIAVNQASESLRWIRDYVDELATSLARCEERNDVACSVCIERGRIAEDIRRLLPAIPLSSEEETCASTETSDP